MARRQRRRHGCYTDYASSVLRYTGCSPSTFTRPTLASTPRGATADSSCSRTSYARRATLPTCTLTPPFHPAHTLTFTHTCILAHTLTSHPPPSLAQPQHRSQSSPGALHLLDLATFRLAALVCDELPARALRLDALAGGQCLGGLCSRGSLAPLASHPYPAPSTLHSLPYTLQPRRALCARLACTACLTLTFKPGA